MNTTMSIIIGVLKLIRSGLHLYTNPTFLTHLMRDEFVCNPTKIDPLSIFSFSVRLLSSSHKFMVINIFFCSPSLRHISLYG